MTADKLRQYWEAHQEETRALLARLQAALAAPIVESGDEAHMPYGPEHEVVFVREDGVWRIEDRTSPESDAPRKFVRTSLRR